MQEAAVIFSPAPEDPIYAGATLSVDLKALQDNWRMFVRLAGDAECSAVVKGDAYGVGLEPVARALWSAGCKTFFVALPHEAITLRKVLEQSTIYVLDGLLAGAAALYGEHDLRPVLASLEEISEWRAHCASVSSRLSAGLHIETGINRLGLSSSDVATLAGEPELLDGFDVLLVMSHLASGDNPGDPLNRQQLDLFNELRSKIAPGATASIANSPGCFLGADFALDMVRPGIALFGGNPFANRPNPMTPVAHLYAPILQVRDIAEGDTVGYSQSWRAARQSRIAVIGIGYCDGYPHALSSPAHDGPAQVMIGGSYAPVIGRVSMDMITVDITDVPDEFARRGVCVEIMGDNITADEIAAWAGTKSYEILSRLGSRYARLYSSIDSS